MGKYILALDVGTTSVRAIVWNAQQRRIVGIEQVPLGISFPDTGYVEQDAEEIFNASLSSLEGVVRLSGINGASIKGLGITNQRETLVVWDKSTGLPLAPAISWQDKRTAILCSQLSSHEPTIRNKTGLVLNPYFTAPKIKWVFDANPELRKRAKNGDVLVGTLDSYVVWRLTQKRMHLTDMSNASRTLLFNINTLKWDKELMSMFDVPKACLPLVSGSIGYFGDAVLGFGSVPIISVMGDQQCSLFGQACFEMGDAKHTYGTGGFLLANMGNTPKISPNKLLTTVAWFINGSVTYALEGSIFNAGSVVQWIRDNLGLIKTASESETLALSVADNGGVYFVPAFGGLGAPYWDSSATGTICGVNRNTSRAHIVRAAIESMAYGVHDLMHTFSKEDVIINRLKVDGGACVNNFLLQFQADILKKDVIRSVNLESTAQGAILSCALGSGMFSSLSEISCEVDRVFKPQMAEGIRRKNIFGWTEAVGKSRLKHTERVAELDIDERNFAEIPEWEEPLT